MMMLDIGQTGRIMTTGEDGKAPARKPRTRKRRYYKLGFDHAVGPPGLFLENLDVLADHRTQALSAPAARGFPNYPEPPGFVFDRKRGRQPRDLELYHDYWLVSDRTKAVFEAVDPDAFAFVACNVRLSQGEYNGVGYWLCDVIRVLDALDEASSRVKIVIGDNPASPLFGKKYYIGGRVLVFKDGAVGTAHAFRMEYLVRTVACDQVLKDACKNAGLTGIRFTDMSKL